jgi:hypothetical protein
LLALTSLKYVASAGERRVSAAVGADVETPMNRRRKMAR